MATFTEIIDILTRNAGTAPFTAAALFDKVGVATLAAASLIALGNDTTAPFSQAAGAHDKRVMWAVREFSRPRGTSEEIFNAVVSANASATQAQILQASDVAIQNNVNAVIDAFATAMGSPPA